MATDGGVEVREDPWLPPFVHFLFPEQCERQYEPLVDGRLFRHPAFDRSISVLNELDEIDAGKLSEHSVLLLAESRLGKTRLLTEFISKRLPQWRAEGLYMPAMYVQVPEHPTIRSLCEVALAEFGEVARRRETAGELTARLVKLLRGCGVRYLCFDDLHQFIDSNGELTQTSLTNWLRILSLSAQVALVVAGLDRTEDAVRRNEQLYNRFDAKLRLKRFDWSRGNDRSMFFEIIELLHGSMGSEFPIEKATPEIAFQWYLASGGRIGLVIKIARRAMKLARAGKKARKITKQLLDEAWERSDFESGSVADDKRPFLLKIDVETADLEKLSTEALQRGKEAAPRAKTSPRRRTRTQVREAIVGR